MNDRTSDSQRAAAIIRERTGGLSPRAAVVLGSGMGTLAEAVEAAVAIPFAGLPGFPAPGVQGHDGSLVIGRLGGTPVAVMRGRGHYYENGDPNVMRGALEGLAAAGCDTVILTNAVGSLRPEVGPGSLMLIADHINLTGINPLVGTAGASGRFVDMTRAYDAEIGRRFRDAAARLGIDLADGTFMFFTGPSFETPAEIRAARVLGADSVGMSVVPEVVIARHIGLRVGALSLVTNLAAGMVPGETLSHERTLSASAAGAESARRLITAVVGEL